jgi:hypothetical protein
MELTHTTVRRVLWALLAGELLIRNVVLDVMTVGVSSWAWVYSWPMGQAARFCVQEAGPGVEYMCGPEYWVSQSRKKPPKIAAHCTEGIMTQKQNLTAAGIALHTAIAKNHGPLLSAVSSFLLAGVGKILLHGKEQKQSPAWRGNGRASARSEECSFDLIKVNDLKTDFVTCTLPQHVAPQHPSSHFTRTLPIPPLRRSSASLLDQLLGSMGRTL